MQSINLSKIKLVKSNLKSKIYFFVAIWFMFLFAIVNGACVANAQSQDKINYALSQNLIVNLKNLPKSFDPQNFINNYYTPIASSLYEGLVIKNNRGEPVAGAAKSYTNQNNKVFIFKLRDNLRWSNGDPLTASDFVYGFHRILDPKNKNPYTWYMKLMNIKNTDAILAGKMPVAKLGVSALDAKTVKIELEKPVAYFLDMLTYGIMIPIHQKSFEKNPANYWQVSNLGKIITNGAYVISKSESNKLELTPNPNYWDKDKVKIKKVSFITERDKEKRMQMFFDGKIHISILIKPDEYWSILRRKPKNLINVDYLNMNYYQFQSTRAPFNNVKLRKALSYAVNRDFIVSGVLSQQQKSAYTIVPMSLMGRNSYQPKFSILTQNLREKEAKLYFKQAGYGKDKPLKFELLVDDNVRNKITEAEEIIKMWKKVLEYVEVKLVILKGKDYLEAIKNKKYDITKLGWIADYSDMSSFLSVLYSQNYANTLYVDKEYDKILQRAMQAETDYQKEQGYNELLRIIDEQMPIIPLYQDTNTYMVNEKVVGFPNTRSDGAYYVKDLYLRR